RSFKVSWLVRVPMRFLACLCGSLLAYSQLTSLAIAKCVGCYGNLGVLFIWTAVGMVGYLTMPTVFVGLTQLKS
ncbi:hypothetical protein, partial [Microbulbifer echini]